MKLLYLPKYTYEDYKNWQGDWELIEGIPYAMSSSKFEHQRAISRLLTILNLLLSEKNCQCEAVAELDWIISQNTVVRPDLVVLCKEPQDYVREAPPLVVEVVSESSKDVDELVKMELYRRQGVKYYLLVYPEKKLVKAYKNTGEDLERMDGLVFDIEGCSLELTEKELWR